MAKYLVTGGAGFIGTNLCDELIQRGHTVVAIDNLSVSDRNVPHLKQLGVDFQQADIADYTSIEPHFKDVDVVFHLAAMNRAPRSIERPVEAHHVNITGTVHVLEAMRKHGVSKIVFAGSSSVYAGRSGLLAEDDPVAPPHPYGVGKLAGEHYVRVYSELYGLDHVILRFFTVYGPRQLGTIDKAGVVAKFIHNARMNETLPIYGDGSALRNFTYVSDVVRCCLLAAHNKKAKGHIINIANPNEISVKDLAELIREKTGTTSKIDYLDERPGDPLRNAADVSKSQRILEYHPKISFEEGIEKTIDWHEKVFKIEQKVLN